LEYLDVFDFFNMPRLPFTAGTENTMTTTGNSNGGADYQNMDGIGNNEFNITNFMYDANADWFMKNNTQ
jgi:hypothetical protein